MIDLPGRNFHAEELQFRVTALEAGLDSILAILSQKKDLRNIGDARLDAIINEAADAALAARHRVVSWKPEGEPNASEIAALEASAK